MQDAAHCSKSPNGKSVENPDSGVSGDDGAGYVAESEQAEGLGRKHGIYVGEERLRTDDEENIKGRWASVAQNVYRQPWAPFPIPPN